jgi:hypothetical protein
MPIAVDEKVENAALIGDFSLPGFVAEAIASQLPLAAACLVTGDPDILPDIPPDLRLGFDQAALDRAPIDAEEVLVRLRQILAARPNAAGLVVHMG